MSKSLQQINDKLLIQILDEARERVRDCDDTLSDIARRSQETVDLCLERFALEGRTEDEVRKSARGRP